MTSMRLGKLFGKLTTNDINVTLARIYRKRLLFDRENIPDISVSPDHMVVLLR